MRRRRTEKSTPRARRIGLFCGYGCGNIGNDASLEAAAQIIADAQPHAQLVTITPFVDGAGRRSSVPVVEMNRSMRAVGELNGPRLAKLAWFAVHEGPATVRRLRTIRSLDVIMAPGTGLLDDFEESPAGMPYALLAWTAASRVMRREFHMVGIGAGPIRNPVSRLLMRLAVRLATDVSYRDEASRNYMASLDRRAGEQPVICDLVFASRSFGVWTPVGAKRAPGSAVVGVGIMAYRGWTGQGQGPVSEHYVMAMTRVVKGLVADGHRVRILVGQPIDDLAVNMVLAQLDDFELGRVAFNPTRDFASVLDEIARTDVVVATRYHHVVAALMKQRVVVSVGYSAKNAELLNRVGMADRDCCVEEIRAGWVLDQVRTVLASGAAVPDMSKAIVDSWRELARCAIEKAAGSRRHRQPQRRGQHV
jgi:polysaccharide pyruvyl transferase WcaK-like protein